MLDPGTVSAHELSVVRITQDDILRIGVTRCTVDGDVLVLRYTGSAGDIRRDHRVPLDTILYVGIVDFEPDLTGTDLVWVIGTEDEPQLWIILEAEGFLDAIRALGAWMDARDGTERKHHKLQTPEDPLLQLNAVLSPSELYGRPLVDVHWVKRRGWFGRLRDWLVPRFRLSVRDHRDVARALFTDAE